MAQLGKAQAGAELTIVAPAPFPVEQQRQPFARRQLFGLGIGGQFSIPVRPMALSRSRVGCASMSFSFSGNSGNPGYWGGRWAREPSPGATMPGRGDCRGLN